MSFLPPAASHPRTAELRVQHADRSLPGFVVAGSAIFAELTDREREVLELVARGRNNTEIARALFISGKTVRNHVSNVFTKLQVTDRAQAIVRAREAGLG